MPNLQKVVTAATADVLKENGTRRPVLVMVEDDRYKQLTLPTGGKKASDKSLEAAARREFCEETLVIDLESETDMHPVCRPFVWRPDHYTPTWNERYEYHIFVTHLGTLTEEQVKTYIADFKTKREDIQNDTSMERKTKDDLLESRSLVFVPLDSLKKLSIIWPFMTKEVLSRLEGEFRWLVRDDDNWTKSCTGTGRKECDLTFEDPCIQFRKPPPQVKLSQNQIHTPRVPLQPLAINTVWQRSRRM